MSIRGTVQGGGDGRTVPVTISTTSPTPVTWRASVTARYGRWISFTVATDHCGFEPYICSGTVVAGSPAVLYVHFGFPNYPGTYTETVTINAPQGSSQSISIPVTADVVPYNPWIAARSDFSGDGWGDLLWQDDAEGYVALWTLRTGDAGLMESSDLLTPGRVADTNWKIVGTGDFNGDGKPDIVWQHQTEGWLALWRMNRLELVSSDLFMPSGVSDTNWKVVGVNDFNQDDKPDLLWREQTQGWLGVWLMDGTTLVNSIALTPERVADTNWVVKGTGDFNGDGYPDIVWQEPGEGWVAVWLMNGTTLIDSVLSNPERIRVRDWEIQAVTQWHSNRRSNLLWRHMTTGELMIWGMNGAKFGATTPFVPDKVDMLNWRIVGPR